MVHRVLTIAAVVFSVPGVPRAELVLSEGGTAVLPIILGADISVPERTAASELKAYLEEVTGATFPLREETAGGDLRAGIHVGRTRFAAAQGIDPAGLGAEEWVIRVVEGSLILAGGRPRGVLYAVYRFLEEEVGVHWWNPWEESVPSLPRLAVTDLDLRGRPVFPYRDIYMLYGNDGGRFAARNRLNRDGDRRISGEVGGCMDYGPPYHVHTFYLYLPPKQYFASHPEYYSLIKGERCAERHQLCLTNPEVRRLMIEKLRQYVESSRQAARAEGRPAPLVFDISQNDWYGACQCEPCQAVVTEEGGECGLLLQFLNHISDAVRPDYPGIFLDTLAYQYTQDPPATVRPRDNIIVRLCDTTSNFTRPITAPDNKSFHDILTSWSKIARNLRIWDYAVTYAPPRGLPFPSEQTYATDYRFYAAHNVEGVFTEHEYTAIADMRDLKVWLMMKLLEDPRRDYEELRRVFTDGFYGPAGALMRRYRDRLAAAAERRPSHVGMSTGLSGFGFVDLEFVLEAQEFFDAAEETAAGDSRLLRRVRHARLSLDRATVVRFRTLMQQWVERGTRPEDMPLSRDGVAQRARRTWLEQIELRIPEGNRQAERKKTESEITKYTAMPAYIPLPERFQGLATGSVFDFTADATRNWRDIVKVVKDDEAESGITDRLEFPTDGEGGEHSVAKYKLPMPWGLYAPATKTFVTSSRIVPEDVPGPGYHWYRMGPHKIGRSYYLYFFWSWIIQVDIDSVMDPAKPEQQFDVWARIKLEGPTFPHGRAGDRDAICVERVVLVKEDATRRAGR